MRIELTPSAWKAEVLPLNYIRKLERKTRFELATLALARRCSTPEPLPHNIGRGRWIRTTESSANGFTVRPLWPLGNPSIKSALLLYHILSKCPVVFQLSLKPQIFCGAGGGNSHPLRVCRPCLRSSQASDISLFENPPDHFTTLEPFRVRFLLELWSWRRESNPQPADYKSAALPLSHASLSF